VQIVQSITFAIVTPPKNYFRELPTNHSDPRTGFPKRVLAKQSRAASSSSYEKSPTRILTKLLCSCECRRVESWSVVAVSPCFFHIYLILGRQIFLFGGGRIPFKKKLRSTEFSLPLDAKLSKPGHIHTKSKNTHFLTHTSHKVQLKSPVFH